VNIALVVDGGTFEIPSGFSASLSLHSESEEQFQQQIAALAALPGESTVKLDNVGPTVWASREFRLADDAQSAFDVVIFPPAWKGETASDQEHPALQHARQLVEGATA
jgi:hypothetical protein